MNIPSPFPFTKVCGSISAAAGALAAYAATNNLKKMALWAGGVFAASSALGTFLSRSHNTSDEDAKVDAFSRNIAAGGQSGGSIPAPDAKVDAFSRNIADQTRPAPPPVPVDPKI